MTIINGSDGSKPQSTTGHKHLGLWAGVAIMVLALVALPFTLNGRSSDKPADSGSEQVPVVASRYHNIEESVVTVVSTKVVPAGTTTVTARPAEPLVRNAAICGVTASQVWYVTNDTSYVTDYVKGLSFKPGTVQKLSLTAFTVNDNPAEVGLVVTAVTTIDTKAPQPSVASCNVVSLFEEGSAVTAPVTTLPVSSGKEPVCADGTSPILTTLDGEVWC